MQNIFIYKSRVLNLQNLCLVSIIQYLIDKNKFKQLNINFKNLRTQEIESFETELYKNYANLIWALPNKFLTYESLRDILHTNTLEISPNGKLLITSSGFKMAKIWNLDSKNPPYLLPRHTNLVNALAISSDCRYVVTGSSDKTVIVWKLKSGKIVCLFKEHKAPIEAVAISTNNEFVASCSFDGKIKSWDIRSGISFFESENTNVNNIKLLNITPDDKSIIAISETGIINFWDLESQTIRRTIKNKSQVLACACITEDSSLIAAGCFNGTVTLWYTFGNNKVKNFRAHDKTITAIKFGGNKSCLASASLDGKVKLWNIELLSCICILSDNNITTSIAISKDNKKIVAVSTNNLIKIWKVNLNLEQLIDKIRELPVTKVKPEPKNCLIH